MNTHKYDSILHQPYRKSADRPQMSMHDRAAQFAPFATVTGHNDEIKETERLTGTRHVPTEEEAAALDAATKQLMRQLASGKQPQITVTWFMPDEKKEGGSYQVKTGHLRRIDTVHGYFLFTDGEKIPVTAIFAIRPFLNRL